MKGLNIGGLMKQAQQMQAKIAQMQEEMAKRTVEASSGGGMVTAQVNGKGELLSIKIEQEVFQGGDRDLLQDLVVAAVNEGLKKSHEMVAEEMSKLTGGLPIPGLNF